MKVPFVDLARQHVEIRSELDAAVAAVVSGSQFILGPAVERFEASFARYLGVEYCQGVNNGTSALHLALLAAGVGPEDEVITTPLSWVSTTWAISYVGARPVFVDVDPHTFALDPSQVERAITARTKAILPVHLYGQAADLPALSDIAERHGLWLIEDAAQAHGAMCQGRRIGSWGDLACFSFYPGKNLGAWGEGGAVVTSDPRMAERIRCLRDHAQQRRHEHVSVGYNCRLEGLQGAVLDVKLRRLDAWNQQRREAAQRYLELLADCEDLALPSASDPTAHVWHLFVVRVASAAREAIRRELEAKGVATAVHYPRLIPFQPVYHHLGYRRGAFPIAEAVADRCLSLPMFPGISTAEIDQTAAALQAALAAVSDGAQVIPLPAADRSRSQPLRRVS